MARLSISEAIRQSGVSRSTFYEKYIKQGLISVSESNGKKHVDTSEVFGELKGSTEKDILEQLPIIEKCCVALSAGSPYTSKVRRSYNLSYVTFGQLILMNLRL